MSHRPATIDPFPDLSDKLKAWLLKIGRKVTEGYEGEIHMTVGHGGIREIRWVQIEKGGSIQVQEDLG